MTTPLKRAAFIGAAVLPVAVAGMTVAPSAHAAPTRHVLAGTHPAWAKSTARVASANAASTATITGRIYLQFNNASGARALAAAVSNPSSASYRHYVTAAQFEAKFRPTDAAVQSVSSWLKSSGLTVGAVPTNHRYVTFSGAQDKVAAAFATTFGTYRFDGQTVRAPNTDASIPSSIASAVLSVIGLDSYEPAMHKDSQPPSPPSDGFRNAPLCSQYYHQQTANFQLDGTPLPTFRNYHPSWAQCGFTPPQLRGAYGVTGGAQNGAGVTVAITDAYHSGTMVQDANQYFDNHFSSAPDLVMGSNYFETNAATALGRNICGDWSAEEALDVEAVHSIAPNARIHYYGARSCFDVDLRDAIQNALDDGVDVISNSWGGFEAKETTQRFAAYNQLFTQAAAQGTTVLFSSGDSGDNEASFGQKDPGYPDSDPLVTAAGGTSLGIDKNNHIAFESGWGTVKWALSEDQQSWEEVGFIYGSGGGVSAAFDRPHYQDGVVTQSTRVVPDLSADGDVTTGMRIGLTQDFGDIGGGVEYGEYRIGGTSLSSPLLAGMVALTDQAAHAQGKGNVGFMNPAIYQLYKAHSAAIRDVVHRDGSYVRNDYVNSVNNNDGYSYSVRTVDQDSSLKTTAGYDMVTGVGTPTGSFYATLAGLG